jgi:uncharacterized protein YbaR (Trm112 family)
MQNEIAIDLQELTKIFVVCRSSQCGAEVGFDLTQQKLFARAVACPVCNEPLLAVNQQEHMAFTWVSFVQKLLQAEGKPRMFFKLKQDGR